MVSKYDVVGETIKRLFFRSASNGDSVHSCDVQYRSISAVQE